MKLIIGDGIILYLNKLYIRNKDIDDIFIKNIINKICKKHKIDLYGFVDVKIYSDNNYGVVIVIKKNELDYFDYFRDELEMNIEIINDNFLYKISDITYFVYAKNSELYKCHDIFYLYIKDIDDANLGRIVENCEIIYGEKARGILEKNNRVSLEVI